MVGGRTDGRMDGWTEGRMDGWTEGRVIGRLHFRYDRTKKLASFKWTPFKQSDHLISSKIFVTQFKLIDTTLQVFQTPQFVTQGTCNS